MPITSLESFLFERKLVSVSQVEILQNATLGIDVEHYLGRIYTFKKEQLLFGIGGVPMSLKAYIESDLAVFKEFNIRPLFVFPGLHINLEDDLLANELTESEAHRELAWNRLHAKLVSSGGNLSTHYNESFRPQNDSLSSQPMMNDLIKYFIEYDIDYIICPSDPSFQLSYMYQSNVVDCVYGSTDLLLTHIDKFILGMEFLSKDFRYVDKVKVLYELGLTEKQFIDVSIIVGCSVQPKTFSSLPPLPKHNSAAPFQQVTHFKYGLDLMYQYKTFQGDVDLYPYVSSLNDELLLNLYCRGKSAMKYMPVMNSDGLVGLYLSELMKLNNEVLSRSLSEDLESKETEQGEKALEISIPSEIHEVILQRLPSEIFFYLSLGLLPIKIMESIVLDGYRVRPPIEGTMCEGFKKMILSKGIINVINSQFNMVTQLLARYYQMKKVTMKVWFSDEVQNVNPRMSTSISSKLSSSLISDKNAKFSLAEFFKSNSEYHSEKTSVTSDLTLVGDLISTSVLRSFLLLDMSQSELAITSFLRPLIRDLVLEYPDIEDTMLEDLTLLLVLMRFSFYDLTSLDSKLPSVPGVFKINENDPSQIDTKNKVILSVISRVFSLCKLRINPINYQGPISRSLLSFRTHHQFLRQLMSDSVRLCLVDLITRLSSLKLLLHGRDQWYELVDSLPYFKDANNTLLGVMSEIFFDGCLKLSQTDLNDGDCGTQSLDHLLQNVMQVSNPTFNINLASSNSLTASQITRDLQSGTKFWKYFMSAVAIGQSIDESFVSRNTVQIFRDCDEVISRFSATFGNFVEVA